MNKPTLSEIFASPPLKAGTDVLVPIDKIDVRPDRLRPANADYAALLAEDVEAGRQLPAIQLRPRHDKRGRYWLVVGLHRLEGHKLAEQTHILATVEDMSDAEARLREIDENLHRAELNALDRALFLAERKRVFEELHPETAHGRAPKSRKVRGSKVAESATLRFTAEAATRIGLSERSIQEAVKLAKGLAPDVIKLIRGTYLEDHASDLQALARLSEAQQHMAVRKIASGKAKNLKDASGGLGRGSTPPDEQERLFQSVVDAWSRMNAKTRRRVLHHIQEGDKGNAEAARQTPKARA